MGNDSWSPYSMQKYATHGTRGRWAGRSVMCGSGGGESGRSRSAAILRGARSSERCTRYRPGALRSGSRCRPSGRPGHDGGFGPVALFHDPTHRSRARAGAAQALQLGHGLDPLLHRERARHAAPSDLGIEAHVPARDVAVVQVPRQVAKVGVGVGERFAVDPHHLKRRLALAAEETPVGKFQDFFRAEPAVRVARDLEFVQHRLDLVGRVLGEARTHEPAVDVAQHLPDFLDVLVHRLAIRHVLETVLNVLLATSLVAEHLEAAREPLVDRVLHEREVRERIAPGGALGGPAQRDDARREVERLLAAHGGHAAGPGAVGGYLLHRERVLAHAVDECRERDVVHERVVVEVERVQHVVARGHGQELLDHLRAREAAGDVRPVLRQEQVQHLVAVAQLLGHHADHPRAVLVVVRAVDRAGVLLDADELGRRLRLDDHEQMARLVLGQLVGLEPLLLALLLPDVDDVRRAELELRAQAELLVLGEVLLPALEQGVLVLEMVAAPVLDGVVVLLLERDVRDVHGGGLLLRDEWPQSRISSAWSGAGVNPIAFKTPATPASVVSTSVRTLFAPSAAKCARITSNIFLPRSWPRWSGSMPKRSIQPHGSSSPNSPARRSPSMKPTILPPCSATCDAPGSRRV